MGKLSAHDKEKVKQAQEIEALLRASASSAATIVDGWLDSESDHEGEIKARQVFQGRPARLGIGATHLSHKQMLDNSNGALVGVNPLTREELALKRKLTRGQKAPQAEKKFSESKESDQEEESRSQITS
ncbi:hypothetical protein H4S02_008940, partial [Coemansia sp. RSA 2611]